MTYRNDKTRRVKREGMGAAALAAVAFIALLVVGWYFLGNHGTTVFRGPTIEHSTPG